jgi:excinuclease ABC subunit C
MRSLENNLIKTLQWYNVLLRTTSYLVVYKRAFTWGTLGDDKDGSEYFGPYTSFKTVNTILELIKSFTIKNMQWLK